jgi:protein-glutamine gamma-glutamyltransferase
MGRVERFFEFSILGLVASGFLALAGSGFLDMPTIVLTATGLMLRGLLVSGLIRFRLSVGWLNAATLAYIAFSPIDYLYISREFVPTTVHLICYLAVLRILTARSNRDYSFVKVISFLELLAASILSINLSFFLFLAIFLFFGVATFCSSEIRRSAQLPGINVRVAGPHFSRRLSTLAGATSVSILVMTGGLFFLLPRTARAALHHLVSERYHLPGFSNEITLGQLGEIQKDSITVMHIRIENQPTATALKWRGGALADFDGRRWSNPPAPGEVMRVQNGMVQLAALKQQWRGGRRLSYEVNVKALDSDALFFTGVPEFLRVDLPLIVRTTADAYRTGLGVSDGLHYFGYSNLGDDANAATFQAEPLPIWQQNRYVRLPEHDRRIDELARDITRLSRDDLARAKDIEKHLRDNYGYTTTLLSDSVPDPLANFLFERKKGHCEYFASAMAVMLRTLGIPSRVATGFESGVFNPMTGWYMVRTSDAHSWVEAYLPARGWTTFDPTPSESGTLAASLWQRFALYMDTADTFWQEWVLNYNLERQLNLAARMDGAAKLARFTWIERVSTGFQRMGAAIGGLSRRAVSITLGTLALVMAGFHFLPMLWLWLKARRHADRIRRGQVSPHDAAVLYSRMLAVLRRRGFEKPGWLTPMEFARVLPDTPMSATVDSLTSAYNELRFGGDAEAARRMIGLLESLETVA